MMNKNSILIYAYECIYKILSFFHRVDEKVKTEHIKKTMASCTADVAIDRNFICNGEQNISIGEGSSIGPNCVFYAGNAPLTIGKHVMFAPNVTIVTGNHRIDVIGEYMSKITEDQKLPENDEPVIIEDDVWVGSNVTILKGTTIGRGSVIHAGAVVKGNIKPYTIYFSREFSKPRFSDLDIEKHEELLEKKYGK